MEDKPLISAVFANLAQSSRTPTFRRGIYGLSEKQVAVLNKQLANQDAAVTVYNNAITSLFQVFFDQRAKSDGNYSKVSTAIVGMKDAIDPFFDSVLITVEGSFSAAEVARKASYKYLQNAAGEVRAAFELLQSGNYEENQNAIEVHRTKSEENFGNLVERFYELISSSLKDKDADALAVVGNAKNASYLGLVHMNNAVFNAIEVWAAVATAGYADSNFIYDMKDFKAKALFGAKADGNYKFSTLSTFYISACLNKEGIFSKLAANQYALIASYRRYKDGDDVVFNAVRRYLERIPLRLKDDGDVRFSRDDADTVALIRHYYSGDSTNIASFLVLHPNQFSENAAAQKKIYARVSHGSSSYFDAIRMARTQSSNYSEVLNIIETTRNSINSISPNFTEEYFSTIRANQSSNPELQTKLTALTDELTNSMVSCVNAFFDSVVILANATHAGKVSEDDLSRVEALRDVSNGWFEFSEITSAASFAVLLSKN